MFVKEYFCTLRVLLAVLILATAAAVTPLRAAQEEPAAGTPATAAGEGVVAGEALTAAAEAGSAAADSGDHAHHDPYDLSSGDASASIEDPIELRFDLAVATFLVFLVLVTLLTRVAWGPIMEGLDRREAAIATKIAEAEATAEAAAEQLRMYQTQLAAASEEAQAIITQARKNADAIADKIREEARQDAEREHGRAVAEIHAAKGQALREVAQASADMAVGLAGRILHRELRPDDHAALIREALERFPSPN